MAFTFDSTSASATGNSYLSVTEASDYFGGRYGSDAWTGFTDTQKKQLLVTATKAIDKVLFSGKKLTREQALQWPRYGIIDTDGYVVEGVPSKLKEAACEMAFWIWTEDDRLLSDTDIQQVDTYKVGPLDFQVNKARKSFPIAVEELLQSIGVGVVLATTSKVSNQVSISR